MRRKAEAQTLANLYAAMEHDLIIIPVINKIDLPPANIDGVKEEIENELGLNPESAPLCSCQGRKWELKKFSKQLLERIPPPKGNVEKPLAALIFDAQYDSFRGTIVS